MALAAGALLLMAAQSGPLVVASKPITSMRADEVLMLFMQCSVSTNVTQKKWLEWGSFAPEDARSAAELRSLASSECMPVDHSGNVYSLKFSTVDSRGALYNVLYKKAFGSSSAPKISAVSAPDFASEFVKNEAVANIVEVRKLGDCVVVADASAVHSLLIAAPDSDKERQAFTSITPRLAGCMFSSSQLRLSRPFVRGMLAEAAYKRAANIVRPVADKVGAN
jgi:hypothetical protein